MLKGLDFLHSHSMAHLDLKLENYVFDDYFNLKLIDLAFCENFETLIDHFRGSESYVAPEILSTTKATYKVTRSGKKVGEHIVYRGEKADIFSLGVILFTMFFGQVPFEADYDKDQFFPFATSGNFEKAEIFFS